MNCWSCGKLVSKGDEYKFRFGRSFCCRICNIERNAKMNIILYVLKELNMNHVTSFAEHEWIDWNKKNKNKGFIMLRNLGLVVVGPGIGGVHFLETRGMSKSTNPTQSDT